MINQFVVRVYALIIQNNQILISKEQYHNKELIKFPGGGLQFGEGAVDALNRELEEELQSSLISHELFFTPDQCIQSAFNPHDQIISIYYIAQIKWDQSKPTEHQVYWVDLKQKGEAIGFTFQQDLLVYELLQKQLI